MSDDNDDDYHDTKEVSRSTPIPPKERKPIKMGFEIDTITLNILDIAPLKIITPAVLDSEKFKQIVASIREIGIIEPPVVAPKRRGQPAMLLDGHMRIEALKEIGQQEVVCLVSTDDEAFTYNKYISRISPIQEHRMIRAAIERGVSEEKLARALNMNVKYLMWKRDLLNGICPEVAELLKDTMMASCVFKILRRMKPLRQIEAVTLMKDANIYSLPYVQALLAATPKEQLIEPTKPKNVKGLSNQQMARMEAEMGSLEGQYRLIEDSFGPNVLTLTIAKTYLSSLLSNARIIKYLAQHHPQYLKEFQHITEMTSLGGSDTIL